MFYNSYDVIIFILNLQIEKEVPLLGLPALLKAVNKIQLSDTRLVIYDLVIFSPSIFVMPSYNYYLLNFQG